MQEPSFNQHKGQHITADDGYDPVVFSDEVVGQQSEDFEEGRENEETYDDEEQVRQEAARKNGRMLLGLVLGVFSLILWWLPVIGCLIAATGLIISIRRFHQITARKTAYAGVILNSVGLLLGLVFTVGIIFSIVHGA